MFADGLNPYGQDKAIPNMIALVPFFGNQDGKPLSKTAQQQPQEPIGPTPTEPQEPQVPQEPQTTEPVQEPSVDNVAGQSSTDWANQYNQEKGQGISIDNNGNVGYTKDIEKINAPATTPVTKADVQPEIQPTGTETTPDANSEPVQKSDVQPENDLTPKYQNMMERWDKLN